MAETFLYSLISTENKPTLCTHVCLYVVAGRLVQLLRFGLHPQKKKTNKKLFFFFYEL